MSNHNTLIRYYNTIIELFKNNNTCFKPKFTIKYISIYNLYKNFYLIEVEHAVPDCILFTNMLNYMFSNNIITESSGRYITENDLDFQPEIYEHHYRLLNPYIKFNVDSYNIFNTTFTDK